jgi:hypothetical protein
MKKSKVYLNSTVILLFITAIFDVLVLHSQQGKDLEWPKLISTKTTNLETLKKVCLARLEDVGNIFEPVISEQYTMMKTALEKCNNYKQLQALSQLIPYTSKGLEGVKPLDYPLQPYNPFQFEVGTSGWYWSYATFEDVCATYMIVRLELGNKNVRKQFDLKLGSTTLYLCAYGIGGDNNWMSNDLTILPGTYTADYTNGSFNLECVDQNKKETYTLKFSRDTYNFTYKNKNNFGVTITSRVVKPGCINGKNGCVPACISGIGTDYWSYPQLQCTMTVDEENFEGGVGWMDRQWMKSGDPKNVLLKSVANIATLRPIQWGLGKYVWITIHDNNTQYMVYAVVNNIEIKKNLDITKQAKVIKYFSDGTCTNIFKVDQLKITDVMTVEKTLAVYPTKYTVQIENRTYNVDGTKYTGITTPGTIFDQSGNKHWAASAGLTDGDGNSVGSAFIEASMMQPEKEYQTTLFNLGGISSQHLDKWKTRTTLTSALPSIIIVTLFLALNGYLLYKAIKKNRQKVYFKKKIISL